MFTMTQQQILVSNLTDERDNGEASHLLLYCDDSDKLDEVLKFTYSSSLRVLRPIVIADINKINMLPSKEMKLQRRYVHQLLNKTGRGTLIVKNIDAASPELQHYFKYLLEYSRDLDQKSAFDQTPDDDDGIPVFKGRFIFTAKSSASLSHQFLTWVNGAIVVSDEPGTEPKTAEA